jgi:5-methylcytosine-specific restriction endonuclease McrA
MKTADAAYKIGGVKRCSKCGETDPAAFWKNQSYCKSCARVVRAAREATLREQRLGALLDSRVCLGCQDPIPRAMKASAEYCSRACMHRAAKARWVAANPEAKRAADAARWARTRDAEIAQRRAERLERNAALERKCAVCGEVISPARRVDATYCSRRCERSVSRARERAAPGYAERARARSRRHHARHPETTRDSVRRRRARLRNAYVANVKEREIYERDGGVCGICGNPVAKGAISMDHVVPLHHGGTHEPSNVQLAHRRCNSGKGATMPTAAALAEFRRRIAA